jgi:K+-transporting ATPase c subunit
LLAGTYVFSLTVTDNKGATNTDLLSVVVLAGNATPIADAGPDQTITLPLSTIYLSGSGTDAGGTITSYTWNWVRGPNTPTIANSNNSLTLVSGLQAGTHVFSLTVTDNNGATNTDLLSVVVLGTNTTLTANAGPDQTITLPLNTIYLSGSGTDAGGTITSYAWKWERGPNIPIIVSSNSSLTLVTGLQAGTHVFSLTVTDNNGATNTDMLSVVVLDATTFSTANVSADQTITSAQVGVKVYPNPFANYIDINITGGIAGKYDLMLVDALGKVVWIKSGIKNSGAFQQSVNTSTLERGIYFLKVIQNNTNSVIKLVK